MRCANSTWHFFLRPCATCELHILVDPLGDALNPFTAPGLGFSLLQYFVDHVQRLYSRADSSMLMKQAHEMRTALLQENWPEKDLPKLEGGAGHQWFRRWRKKYGIVKKVTGMK